MMKRLRGCLGVFLIFAFGVIVGGVLVGLEAHRDMIKMIDGGPDAVVGKIAKRLKNELDLDEDQKRMLSQIATEAQIKLRTIHARNQPEIDAALSEAADKVRAILKSDQRIKFEQIIGRTQDKWRENAKPMDPITPPPPVEPASKTQSL
jgi:hypothetical protein